MRKERRFILSVLIIDAAIAAALAECGGDLTTRTGEIVSPNFPGNYFHSTDCEWTIRAKEGSVITLTFTKFKVESHMECQYDYLKIYNGGTKYPPNRVAKLCGSALPDPIVSSGNVLLLWFHSDGTINSPGFRLTFTTNSSYCRDEDVIYDIKVGESWKVTPCLACRCNKGLLSCQKNVTVFFPGYRHSYALLKEFCHQPSCNVSKFIKEKQKDACEGVELIKDAGILLKYQTWDYKGCKFLFNGTNEGDVCHPMASPVCHVHNGSICCAAECAALQEIANKLRGNLTMCRDGLQLVADTVPCGNFSSRCLRDPRIQTCSSEASCEDEDSNKYFDGAQWTVGDCTQCSCNSGKIHCLRDLSVVSSLDEEKEIIHYNEPDVNHYTKKHRGLCKACKWNGTLYFDGDNWKEDGIVFYCSTSNERRVRSGCSLVGNRIKCTEAITGIRNVTSKYKDLFLCKSDDEIVSINDRCDDQKGGCHDYSDEESCDDHYCRPISKYSLPRAPNGASFNQKCSLVNAAWTGTFYPKCDGARWMHDTFTDCYCEMKDLVEYFEKKITEVKNTNVLDIANELSDSVGNFTNRKVFLAVYKKLVDAVKSLLSPFNSANANTRVRFCQVVLSHRYLTAGDAFCHRNSDDLAEEIQHLLRSLCDDPRFCRDGVQDNIKCSVLFIQLIVGLAERAYASIGFLPQYYISVSGDLGKNTGVVLGSNFNPLRPLKAEFSRNQLSELFNHPHLNPQHQLHIQLNGTSLGSLSPVHQRTNIPVPPGRGNHSNQNNSSNSTTESTVNTSSGATDDLLKSTDSLAVKQQIKDILKKCKWRTDDDMITEIQAALESGNENVIISNPEISERFLKKQEILRHLELVLICISIAVVIFSVILLSLVRVTSDGAKPSTKHERLFVHRNLLLSLALSYLVYIMDDRLFTTRKEHPAFCTAVTVIQHYLHTAVFTWMLVEGICLYMKLVKVFTVNKQYCTYVAVGWGIPGVIVGLVAAIEPSTYDMSKPIYDSVTCGYRKLTFTVKAERNRCWLNGNMWIYKGPVLAILVANVVFFVILLRVIFGKLASRYGEQKLELAKKGLKSIMALLPLLGVTWLMGFFIEFHIAFRYIFTLLNSVQGVVFFIFHCFLDEQVKDAIRNRFRKQRGEQHVQPAVPLEAKKAKQTKRPKVRATEADELVREEICV